MQHLHKTMNNYVLNQSCWTFFLSRQCFRIDVECVCATGDSNFLDGKMQEIESEEFFIYVRTYTYVLPVLLHFVCVCTPAMRKAWSECSSSYLIGHFSVGLRLLRDLVLKCFYKILSAHLNHQEMQTLQ